MNVRSLMIAMVLGLALALIMAGITILIGNANHWWGLDQAKFTP